MPSVVGALLIVAEDGTSQTMTLLRSSSVGCESMLTGAWAPEEVRPEKREVSIRSGAPQVTYFVDYIQGKTFYKGPRGKYIITEHFLLVD